MGSQRVPFWATVISACNKTVSPGKIREEKPWRLVVRFRSLPLITRFAMTTKKMSASSKFDILAVLLTMAAFSSTALASNSNVGNQCAWNPSGPLGLLAQCRAAYNPTTASGASNWGPWTQRPVCVGPKANRGPAYCAFVKEDFRGEAGLLVLTSPEIAAGDHSFVEDFDPRWTGDTGRRPRPAASDAPPFEVREIPGKGLGAVATAAIRAGDVVLREHPALLQLAEPAEALDRTQAIWVLEEGFVRLPRRDQQRIFDLSRSTGGHVLEDIVRTNTFGATFNDVAHFGLFPRVAVGGKGGAAPVAACKSRGFHADETSRESTTRVSQSEYPGRVCCCPSRQRLEVRCPLIVDTYTSQRHHPILSSDAGVGSRGLQKHPTGRGSEHQL